MTPAGFPETVAWNGTSLRLLDQSRLPAEEVYLDVRGVTELEDCVRRLAVRGAPAIGCAAAFGVLLIAREIPSDNVGPASQSAGTMAGPAVDRWLKEFDARCERLAAVRPTAVNLRWAVERCRRAAHAWLEPYRERPARPLSSIDPLLDVLEREARAILDEDRQMCEAIGCHGARLLQELAAKRGPEGRGQVTVMTHCNAGALATGGCGTALAVVYAARKQGLRVKVFAGETRPLLQGARLTAWELARAGVEVTVICDSMAASVMRAEKPDAAIVGADRIAANGDTANKIGTYGLAVLARHHGIPFFVAAPGSTVDPSLADGSRIPIEERAREEISEQNGRLLVPPSASVFNPAFDVTLAELISAHITEKGVLRPPFRFSRPPQRRQ